MAEIAFYHCLTTSVDEALLTILEKILSLKERAIVMTPLEAHLVHLDQFLWSFKPDCFLPHGTAKDGFSEHQPIFLTNDEFVPNGARFLVLMDGASSKDPSHYKRVIEVFNGGSEEEVALARQKWQAYKKCNFELIYFKQTENRSWQRLPSST
jgi:DNA polymerase-3 subunit chi